QLTREYPHHGKPVSSKLACTRLGSISSCAMAIVVTMPGIARHSARTAALIVATTPLSGETVNNSMAPLAQAASPWTQAPHTASGMFCAVALMREVLPGICNTRFSESGLGGIVEDSFSLRLSTAAA